MSVRRETNPAQSKRAIRPVAQIDYLLLRRTLNIFVLETKHFTASLKITEEGEFLRRNAYTKAWEDMPSPWRRTSGTLRF